MRPRIFYDNALSGGALVASSGTAPDNVLDWRPYTWWQPVTLPATLTVDCGASRSCDYALVYGHNLWTSGCTIEVRGSTDNFAASNVLVATRTPTSNDPLLLQFSNVSYRYWRIRIIGATTPSLAIVSVGAGLDLPGYLDAGFDPLAREVVGVTNRNAKGQPLGKIIEYTQQQRQVTLRYVTPAWIRSTFLPAWRAHLRSTPFVFAWNTSLDPDNLSLVVCGDRLSTPHQAGNLASLTFDITGAVD